MEIRKLVKSGTSSHTISLPKEWLEKNKLKKGDMIHITEENNELKISKSSREEIEKPQKEITIDIDNQEINSIRRKTIAAYINNYQIFTFHGNSLNKRLEEIRKILHNFLALEVVEQTDTKLIAKDFLNLKEFSLQNTIRRMDMLVRSTLSDAKKGNQVYDALCYRDFETDKLFFLISRLIRADLAEDTIKNKVDSLSMWWLAKNLESIGDAAKNISKIFNKDIKMIYDKVEEFYLECSKAYFKKDKELADKMIEKRIHLLEDTDKLKGDQKHLIRGLINNSRNIAKIRLDN